MVVMAVTEHDCIGSCQVDVERLSVLNEQITLTRIEKNMPVAVFDPERQAMLSL